MGNFNRENKGFAKRGNDRGGSRDSHFSGRREERPEMFKAICADCGKSCEIPFKPNSNRPVFCSTCFGEHNGDDRRDDSRRKEMFEAVCGKCGKSCEVPFKPMSGKPVFCSQCFDRDNTGRDNRDSRDSRGGRDDRNHGPRENNHDHSDFSIKSNDQYKEQFEKLNAKLDMILSSLKPVAPVTKSEIKAEKIKPEVKEMKIDIKELKKETKVEPKIVVKKAAKTVKVPTKVAAKKKK